MAEIRAQVDINVKQNGKTNSSKKGIKEKVQEQKALNKEIKASGNFMERFNKTLQSSSIAGWAALIKKTTNFLIAAGKEQAGYVENLNLMQVAFGETADAAENFTDNLTKVIGLDPNAMTRQLGVFRQLSSAMGYSAETANLLSYNLSKLQLDMASLYNLDFDQAGNALESAVTGRIQTIRSLTGVDITNAALQQFALANGIEESIHSMTRAEKALLIYLSLEEQLTNANGDLANTINSVSNQTKIFKEQISVAGRQLGAVFIPILKTILPLLNGILMAFNELVAMFLTLIGADASSLTDQFGTAGSGLNEIEDGLNGISTASKEAKKSLRGFDKLNNITTPTTAGGGGGANDQINSKILDMLKEYNLHLDKMKNKATKIKENIMAWLGFSKDVNGEWQWSAGTLLKNVWNWWVKLNGAAKIFVSLGAVAIVTKLYQGFKKLGDYLKKTKIGAMIGKNGIAGSIISLEAQYGKFATFVEILVGLTATVDGIIGVATGIKEIAENGWSLQGVAEIIWGVVEAFGGILTVYGALTGNVGAIIGGIAAIAGAFGGEFLTNLITGKDKTQELYDTLNSEIWNEVAVLESTKKLSEELEKYIDANGKVKESDQDRVKYILNEMNEAFGTEYKLIDGVITHNGKLIDSYEDVQAEIDQYLAKKKAQIIEEKYQSAYADALVKQEEKQKLLNKAQDEHEKVLANIDSKYDEILALTGDVQETEDILNKARQKATEDYQKQLDKINKEYQKYTDLIEDYRNLEEAALKGDIEGIEKYTKEIIGSQSEVSKEAIKEVEKSAKSTSNSVNKYLSGEIDRILKSGYDLSRGTVDDINSAFKNGLITDYQIHLRGILSTEYSGTSKGPYCEFPQKKADGGFVDEGQMFIAREDGPEMVGAIGRKTAVANNDQIVEAISVGVAKAMMATGGRNTTVNITAEGDASGLLDFITFKQKEKNRQFGLG